MHFNTFINLFSVSNMNNRNNNLLISNLADNSIITNTIPQKVLERTHQSFSKNSWVVLINDPFFEKLENSFTNRRIEFSKFFFRLFLKGQRPFWMLRGHIFSLSLQGKFHHRLFLNAQRRREGLIGLRCKIEALFLRNTWAFDAVFCKAVLGLAPYHRRFG